MPVILTPYRVIKTLTSDYAIIQVCSDGILQIRFKDLHYTVEMARHITNMGGEASGGKKMLMLGVASEYSDLDSDTRNFMSSPEALRFSLAEAFVLKSLSQRLLGNFYLKFQRPSVPTRLFSDEVEARSWLLRKAE